MRRKRKKRRNKSFSADTLQSHQSILITNKMASAKSKASKSIGNLIDKARHSRGVLYALAALSAIFLFRALMARRVYLVTLFIMVGIIASRFTRNMPTVLGASLCATVLAYKFKRPQYLEGMSSKKKGKEGMEDGDDEDEDMRSDEVNDMIAALKETGDVDAAKERVDAKKADAKSKAKAKKEEKESSEETFQPSTSKFTEKSGTRIDYASTLDDSYNYLDKILSSDGIGKLTKDTQKLMTQQKNLFDTMSGMTDMIKSTKEMVSGLNVDGLGDLAASLSAGTK